MITVALARRLRDAGLRWDPAPGDRFVVADRDMDDEVFTLAEMTVEVFDVPTGRVLGFNGTVEWALDSVQTARCIWLPSEAQLRERLAGTFRSLERADAGWQIRLVVAGHEVLTTDDAVADAYGKALLHLIDGSSDGSSG